MASSPDFPGRAWLIQRIGHVLENDFSPARLCRELKALHAEGGITLPPAALSPRPDRYARHQIHVCERLGYELIVMTWGPGQGSPLHDHDGNWCVECLWQGHLEITRHEPRERDAEGRIRFASQPPTLAHAGEGDWLDAGAEHHTMRNPDPAITAVSLHVYPHGFRQSGWFEPGEDGWHQRRVCDLVLDAWD